MKLSSLLTTIAVGSFLGACATKPALPDKLELQATTYDKLPGWEKRLPSSAMLAFTRSCEKLVKMPLDKKMAELGTAGDWHKPCKKGIALFKKKGHNAKALKDYKKFFEDNFTPHLATNNGEPEGLFTGYYELELLGSKKKTNRYPYPVYTTPKDMQKPYFTRQQIEQGALEGKGLEIAYVADPVRLFFLHIQGSGRIQLPDESIMRVGYDAQNGHPYQSIGKVLIENRVMDKEDVTAPSLKDWLYDNDCHQTRVFTENPSYVFFKERKGKNLGPIGAMAVPLVKEHALAVDKRFVPLGTPIWLDTTIPESGGDQTYQRMLIAQDTGGAIKGAVRGDIFFGAGERAEHLAGRMKHKGNYYLLLPNK